mmetsp:Transcript_5894/g.9559  ORF Transcript_5894/g.9559 Transcript_5894/m.9559 type:complete len:85 (+) Transcript_5894:352-606(+)
MRSSFMSSGAGKSHQSRFSMHLQGSVRLSCGDSPKKQASTFKFKHCRNQSQYREFLIDSVKQQKQYVNQQAVKLQREVVLNYPV